MTKIDFKKEWKRLLIEINKRKLTSSFSISEIKKREFLLYAQVALAKAEEEFKNKNQKLYDFYFALYSISMNHYSKKV